MANSFFSNVDDVLKVQIGSDETTACKRVTQHIEIIKQRWRKDARIEEILREVMAQNGKSIVFCATKRVTDQISRDLKRKGFLAEPIHGDKNQYERDRVLKDFKTGVCRIMVATDVASRGIHVNDITHVINYDFPNNIEDYVHRIGRTGRAGTYGSAYTFFSERTDAKKARPLVKCLEEAGQVVPTELKKIAACAPPPGSRFRGRGRGGRQRGGRGGRGSREERNQEYNRGGDRRNRVDKWEDDTGRGGSSKVVIDENSYISHMEKQTANESEVPHLGGQEALQGESSAMAMYHPKSY